MIRRNLFRFLPPAPGSFFIRSFCRAILEIIQFLVTGFVFSVFSASLLEKAFLGPFVFNMFSA
jgi:hypothetical protein